MQAGAADPGPADRTEQLSLMLLVAQGDDEAFADLHDRIAVPVLEAITQVLPDRSQAEEVAQEVFLELWQNAAKLLAHKGSVTAWATTVARRRATDRRRHEDAETTYAMHAARLDQQRPFDEVVEAVLHRDERDQLYRALRLLSDIQLQSIHLAYFLGYTRLQAAEYLGIPLPTAKSRVRDALILLRKTLHTDLSSTPEHEAGE